MIRLEALALAVTLLAGPAQALFGSWFWARNVPIRRLIRNVTAYVQLHPRDPDGYYALGRLHYAAFSVGPALTMYGQEGSEDTLPAVASLPSPGPGRDANGRSDDLRRAIENLQRSAYLGGGPSTLVTLASVLREGSPYALDGAWFDEVFPSIANRNEQVRTETAARVQRAFARSFAWTDDAEPDPIAEMLADPCRFAPHLIDVAGAMASDARESARTVASSCWRRLAADLYFKAFSWHETHVARNARWYDWAAAEQAARSYVNLVAELGIERQQADRIAAVRRRCPAWVGAGIQRCEPESARHRQDDFITPIVFSLTDRSVLTSLLMEDTTVAFDLDGLDASARWTWVKPDTGILVWDPEHRGQITSGWQLFGSVSFRMFWPDGYRALDALDDNRDGQLTARELDGLAVWFDRNSNGVSDPGEVVAVEDLGIAAIAARATGHSGASPMTRHGVTLTDGSVLPTYDWIAKRVTDPPRSRAVAYR